MRQITVNKNEGNQRLDKYLTKRFKSMPKSLMYKYIRTKYIKVNGKRCEISTKLNVGDVLTFYIKDEFFDEEPKYTYEFLKAPSKIDVIYEDENILLVDKPVGLIVHPDENYHFDSLISRIHHYLYKNKEYDPQEEKAFSPALANRIDRNTCGIVICAKNAESLRILNAKIKDREIKKLYLCLVCGHLKKSEGILYGHLIKDENKNKVKILKKPTAKSKEIKTKYQVLDKTGNYDLVEVDLLTGRTHQIRAHMSFIGHPLAGDTKYGYIPKGKNDIFKYQALCANKVVFDFLTDAGILEYLNGKTFSSNKNNIWFLNSKADNKTSSKTNNRKKF